MSTSRDDFFDSVVGEFRMNANHKRGFIERYELFKKHDSFWKDEEYPVCAVDGKLPTVLTVKEDLRDVSVRQKSIVSADVDITVRNNPRTLGNANYAGYTDAWQMTYKVVNRSKWETAAHMSFPLPPRSIQALVLLCSLGAENGYKFTVNSLSFPAALPVAEYTHFYQCLILGDSLERTARQIGKAKDAVHEQTVFSRAGDAKPAGQARRSNLLPAEDIIALSFQGGQMRFLPFL